LLADSVIDLCATEGASVSLLPDATSLLGAGPADHTNPTDPLGTSLPNFSGSESPYPRTVPCAPPKDGSWLSIPGYEVLGLLGRGAMGVVYLARQTSLNRVVALKVLRGGIEVDPEARERFFTEAEVIARLQHPHVVQIYEVGEHDGVPFLALEYCPGGSLAEKVRGTTLAAAEAAAIVEKLALGMEAAHQRQVIHRDIKPANVLLTAEGEPKVSDFGLARKLDEVSKTQSGVPVGTPCYMPPEQAEGNSAAIGPATDVYALAATLYELLTGRPPFKGATVLETLGQVMTVDPVPPRRLQPGVPRDLETICLKGLQKDRSRRYQTAREFAEELRRFLEHRPILARRTSLLRRAAKWARRQPAQAALAAMVLLAGFGVVSGAIFYGLYERQRVAELGRQFEARQQIEKLLREGTEAERNALAALERKDREAARKLFSLAAGKLLEVQGSLAANPEAGDDDLRQQIAEALGRVQRALEGEDAHQRQEVARRQLQRDAQEFVLGREEVVAHLADPFVGARASNSAHVAALARKALARFGLGSETKPEDAVRVAKRWRELETPKAAQALGAGCCEVLLIWAEAEHRERRASALRLLEVAIALEKALEFPAVKALHERKARYLAEMRATGEAREEEELAERLAPRTALDHFLIALELYQKKQFREAASACGLALVQQPEYPAALYLRGVCFFQDHRYGEAQVEWTAYLSRRPASFEGRALRGTALGLLGLYELAEEDFALAWKQASAKAEKYVVLTNRGAMHIRRGRAELARALSEKRSESEGQQLLRQRLEEAKKDLTEAIGVDGDSYQAYASLAVIHLEAWEWAAAHDAAGKALARKPSGEDLTGLYRARARALVGLHDIDNARADFDRAISRRGKEAREELVSDLVERGRLRFSSGDFDGALADAKAALEAVGTFALAHRLKAEALLKLPNRQKEASAALDAYLAQGGPPTAVVYKARGLLHSECKQLPEALTAFTLALRLQPADIDTLGYRSWTYLQLNAPAKALEDFEAVLKKDAQHADALCGRGHARAVLGQVPEAIADARAVMGCERLTPRLVVLTACIYARAAAQLGTPSLGRPEVNPRDIGFCQEQAMKRVIDALERVTPKERAMFWRQHIREEPALAPIHNQPLWRQLEQRFRD
jgi:predicted Ser/Thr protein kinase